MHRSAAIAAASLVLAAGCGTESSLVTRTVEALDGQSFCTGRDASAVPDGGGESDLDPVEVMRCTTQDEHTYVIATFAPNIDMQEAILAGCEPDQALCGPREILLLSPQTVLYVPTASGGEEDALLLAAQFVLEQGELVSLGSLGHNARTPASDP